MRLYFLSPLILQQLIWLPTRLALFIFGRLEVRGLENLKGLKGNVIFACNHSSELDPILLPAALPFLSRFSPMFYTSREKGLYQNSGWRQILYGGLFFKIWGSYSVLAGKKDYEKSLATHIKIIDDGGNLCFYPEGGITPDGSIQAGRGGVSYLALRTGRPIVPVRLNGSYRIFLTDFFLRKRKLGVTFGQPITNEDLSLYAFGDIVEDATRYKKMSEYIMNKISSLAAV